MLTFLYKLIVGPFYARNAGTFLVIILLAFGFLSAREHKALITAALGSPFLLLLVFVLWGLYTLKTITYVRQELTAPEHLFLQTFWLAPTAKRWVLWGAVQVALLAPVIAYGGWMIQIAATYQKWDSLGAVASCLFVLVGVGVTAADYRLRHPNPEGLRLPGVTFRLPYVVFFPMHWLRYEPLSLVLTKVFSGLLLAGVCRLYPTDEYDTRLLLIGLLLAILGHSQVGRQLSEFEYRYLLLLPNLPLSWRQRFSRYVVMHGLIWLPELLILLRNCPTDVSMYYVIWLWLTGWGWLLLMHSLAYGRSIIADRWLSGIFAAFIGGLLVIMFGLPIGAWLIIGWIGALVVWYRHVTLQTSP